jgi:four helix bundle protein
MKFEKFEDLPVWQKARVLCKRVFEVTSEEPFKNDYKFRDQIKASSGSVMDNIAEGFERSGNKEFIQFLYVAKGSCGEVRSQSHRAYDSNYLPEVRYKDMIERTENLSGEIAGFISYLKKSGYKGDKYLH